MINPEIFLLIILPILIFIARVIDVTFGTIRIIFVSRGRKYLAPIFGFFEIIIWLFAITQIMQHLTNIVYYIAYAGGFATGTFVGIYIEEKMAIGTVIVRIITKQDTFKLVEDLRSKGYGVTIFDGQGSTGSVKLIFTTIERKEINNVMKIVKKFNPKTFLSIEEVRLANDGIFPSVKHHHLFPDPLRLYRHRK